MSKLIDGKFTLGFPFTTGSQYITSDNIIEHDSGAKLSYVIDALQTGNDNFAGSNVAITVNDNSASAMSWGSSGNTNMFVLDTTNGNERIKCNKKVETNDITNSTSQTTGSILVKGGIGQASGMNTYLGNDIYLPNNRFIRFGDATAPCSIYSKALAGLTFQYNSTDYALINNNGLVMYHGVLSMNASVSTGTCSIRGGSSYKNMITLDIASGITSLYGGSSVQKLSVSNTVNTFISTSNTLFDNVTDATSSTDGNASVRISGGLALTKKLYTGTGIHLPTTGGTSSILNYYEEFSNSTIFSSAVGGGTTATVTVDIVRIGRSCSLHIPAFSIDANGSFIASNFTLPTRLRPKEAVDTYYPCRVRNIGTVQTATGAVIVGGSGTLYVWMNLLPAAFSVGANSGLLSGAHISYICA